MSSVECCMLLRRYAIGIWTLGLESIITIEITKGVGVMKIKAAVCYEFNKPLTIEDIDLAEPRDKEVLVKLGATGICQTDIRCIRDGMGGWQKLPMVYGHEGAGEVVGLGPNVTEFQIGDHVVSSSPRCGTCEQCVKGQPWFCLNGGALVHGGGFLDGTSPLSKNGERIQNFTGSSTFSSHIVADVKTLTKVNKDVDMGVLAAFGCGFFNGIATVMNVLKPQPRDSIAVFGAGAVGMSAILGAKISNCKTIIAVDIVESRLEVAKEMGATHVINSRRMSDVPAEIRKIVPGGVKYVVDTVGIGSATKMALDSMGIDSHMGLIGMPAKTEFDNFFGTIYQKKITAIAMGLTLAQDFIPQMVEWYDQGVFPVDKLIRYYRLEDINQAIADSNSGVTIKPVVRFD